MQIPDVVLVVSPPGGDGCSVLHTGAVKLSRESQTDQLVLEQQQAVQQLQQHISKQHCLEASYLQQLLARVRCSCNHTSRAVTFFWLDAAVTSTTLHPALLLLG